MRTFALLCLTLPATALALPPGPPGPPPVAHIVEHHADQIGIDDATRARVDAIEADARSTLKGLHDDLRAAHDALRDAMDAEVPDRTQVFEASTALAQAELALRNQRLEFDLAVIAELTPAQWADLRAQRPEPGARPPHRR